MNNLKLPAYPLPIALHNNGTLQTTLDVDWASCGFTKLEKAALMLASGLLAKYNLNTVEDKTTIAQLSVELATMILAEAENYTPDQF